jgi:hypothetical protein
MQFPIPSVNEKVSGGIEVAILKVLPKLVSPARRVPKNRKDLPSKRSVALISYDLVFALIDENVAV